MKLQWTAGIAAIVLFAAAGVRAQGPPPPPTVNPEDTWQLHINIDSSVQDASRNGGLTIGTDPNAIDAWDPMDLQGPIRPPSTFVAIYLIHQASEPGFEGKGGLYVQDIRSPIAGSQSKVFDDITVEGDVGTTANPATITLTWGDLTAIDSLIKLTLQDPDDVNNDGIRSYDMRLNPSFSFTQSTTDAAPVNLSHFSVTATNSRQLPAPVISNIQTTGPTATGFGVSFTTDVATTATLQYGTAADALTNIQTLSDASTSHQFNVTGLTPNTPYFFTVSATQTGLGTATSTVQTLTTLQTLTTVGNITVTPATTSATVSFGTSAPATAVIEYGTSQTSLTQRLDVSTAAAQQSVVIPGLTAGTQYFFRVTSSAPGFENLVSDVIPFTTVGQFTVSKPAISNIGSTTATVTVTTNNPSTVTLKYGTTDLSQTVTSATAAATQTFNLTGLTPGTAYQVQATATATGFLDQTSDIATFTTLKTFQVAQAPSVTNLTFSGATIGLTTSVPVTATLTYGTPPFKQTISISQPTTTPTFILTNLQGSTAYPYTIQLQASGFETINLPSLTFTTPVGVHLGNGDIDGDGKVTVADAIFAARIAIGAVTGTPGQTSSADVVLPVGVDVGDVVFILKLAVGLVTLPPGQG